MKANYRNWVPKNLLYLLAFFAFICYAIAVFLQGLLQSAKKKALFLLFFLPPAPY